MPTWVNVVEPKSMQSNYLVSIVLHTSSLLSMQILSNWITHGNRSHYVSNVRHTDHVPCTSIIFRIWPCSVLWMHLTIIYFLFFCYPCRQCTPRELLWVSALYRRLCFVFVPAREHDSSSLNPYLLAFSKTFQPTLYPTVAPSGIPTDVPTGKLWFASLILVVPTIPNDSILLSTLLYR